VISLAYSLSRRGILRSGALGGLVVAGGIDVTAEPAGAAPAATPDQTPIRTYYLSHGGAAGVLGSPTSVAEQTSGAAGAPGLRQHFRGTVYGAGFATCGRPDHTGTVVESTVTWSPHTGTHAVHGDIRARWLELGGEAGELGYPTSEEIPTPDRRGRRSQFEHGEIRWYPDTGAAATIAS
jgi:LGFP repeat